jgi:hypothetical protein
LALPAFAAAGAASDTAAIAPSRARSLAPRIGT